MFLFAGVLTGTSAYAQSSLELQLRATDKQREQTANTMAPSIVRQIASLRRSGPAKTNVSEAPGSFFVTEALLPPPEMASMDCPALPQHDVIELADGAARANQISPDLVRAVMRQESRFHPCAVSVKGAMGLMQLMPRTAADLNVSDAFDPHENVWAGARFLRQLLDRYSGDVDLALSAYNAGPARVDAVARIPHISETANYVEAISRDLAKSEMAH